MAPGTAEKRGIVVPANPSMLSSRCSIRVPAGSSGDGPQRNGGVRAESLRGRLETEIDRSIPAGERGQGDGDHARPPEDAPVEHRGGGNGLRAGTGETPGC